MRVALLGWYLEEDVAAALGGLGVEVVAFTRWFPDQPAREAHHGWLEVRCPHEIGGGPHDEAVAFGVAAVREASTSGLGFEFDVVHALDWRTRDAAGELAARAPGSVLVGSHDDDDLAEGVPFGPRESPDAWLCDHPWSAETLRRTIGGEADVFTVPTAYALALRKTPEPPAPEDEAGPPDEIGPPAEGPCVVLSLGGGARISPRVLIHALGNARAMIPGLSVALFDARGRHGRLRRWLGRSGLASPLWASTPIPSPEAWNAAVAQAAAVGLASRDPVDDPAAQAAWLAGVPVVGLETEDPAALGQALIDAVFRPERRDHEVRARAALAGLRLGCDATAAGWLRAYLLLVDRGRRKIAPRPKGRPGPSRASEAPRPIAFPDLRSRLTLTPVSSREALASWSLRPDDWRSALQWMGPEAARAALAIRLFDVTDVSFNGLNAHSSFDVELSLAETHKLIEAPYEGRSLAACLGARTHWGYFHPLAHARICHLPRQGLAPPASVVRRLRVMPRSRVV